MKILNNKFFKALKSEDYSFIFRKDNGFFVRWGKNREDNPSFSPFGPELLDIEISTICHGPKDTPCAWCYKSNTKQGKNMSLDDFQCILSKVPLETLTQIAFGIGDIDGNPHMWDIFETTRNAGIVPNVTINGARLTEDHIDRLANLCGAVSISNYDKDLCYNAVQKLTEASYKKDARLRQVNIHQLLSQQTFNQCNSLLEDIQTDSRLANLNAVVFLLLKPKGKRNYLTELQDFTAYNKFVNGALDNKLRIGFDSCTAPSFLKAVQKRPEYSQLEQLVEPCESTCFSLYVNVDGRAFPCSFCEEEKNWKEGIDMLTMRNFLEEVWNNKKVCSFRNQLQSSELQTGCRQCPVFKFELAK